MTDGKRRDKSRGPSPTRGGGPAKDPRKPTRGAPPAGGVSADEAEFAGMSIDELGLDEASLRAMNVAATDVDSGAPFDEAAFDREQDALRRARTQERHTRERRETGRGGRTIALWVAGALVLVVGIVAFAQRRGRSEQPAAPEGREVTLDAPGPRPLGIPRLQPRVVARYPHSREAFTQGLLWHDGHLYESTGLRGRSTLRRVDLESGDVLDRRVNDADVFAEGLARVGDRLFQLTWTSGQALVWSVEDFEPVTTFTYEGEGWGLCSDGTRLIMSDGSDRLTFRDPATFRVLSEVRVRDGNAALRNLNELEWVDGAVWANVWQTNRIVRIDPTTGRVTANVDASGLLTRDEARGTDVLNGIAWIPERHHFVITGKLWPAMFEVEFVPAE